MVMIKLQFSFLIFTLVIEPAPALSICQKSQHTSSTPSRRDIITNAILPASVAAVALLIAKPESAFARDELFKPNPLTNPILEQIRILEQAEADNIRYGGELAPGSPKGREAYANLLIPILEIQSDFLEVKRLLLGTSRQDADGVDMQQRQIDFPTNLEVANKILLKPQFEKLRFKKIFNAFADNIYYSDPDRANAYLGGGAVPKNEQSIAYLLRNEVLTNLDNLQAEVAYLIKEEKAGNVLETDDLYNYIRACTDGMERYLELVPPGELKLAKEILATRKVT
jgi:hypothetical protein